MAVVSVRLGDEEEAFLRGHGLKPGPFAKQAVEREIRRLQNEEAMLYLAKHAIRLDKPVADLIREDRDGAH